MFCENCGNKLENDYKFCTECGRAISNSPLNEHKWQNSKMYTEESWWLRLTRVVYILLYIPLPFLIIVVWSINSYSYNYYTDTRINTTDVAFLYCLISLIVYIALVRLIKIGFLYVVMGIKPEWKKEFTKLF